MNAPEEAVQIAREAVVNPFTDPAPYQAIVAALVRAGWVHDPARVAALEAVAEAAREHMEWPENIKRQDALLAALYAARTDAG